MPHSRSGLSYGRSQPASNWGASEVHDRAKEFQGKVALITGAAGDGIGQACARRLAEGGATVVVTDVHERRTTEVSERITAELGAHAVGIPMDICDRDQMRSVLKRVNAELGPVSILINNAALNVQGDIFDCDIEVFERVLFADVTARWFLSMLAGQQMKAAGGGAIVNIGSIANQRGSAAIQPPYAIAKGAMPALTRGLARAGGPFNIRANEVIMGSVSDTRFMRSRQDVLDGFLPQIPLGRHARSGDIAEAVAFL